MKEKKRYHVVRKNKADAKVMLRGAVCGYLLYLAWRLVNRSVAEPSLPLAAGWVVGGLFAAAAAAFGIFSWREYRKALREAELSPEEAAALDREQER